MPLFTWKESVNVWPTSGTDRREKSGVGDLAAQHLFRRIFRPPPGGHIGVACRGNVVDIAGRGMAPDAAAQGLEVCGDPGKCLSVRVPGSSPDSADCSVVSRRTVAVGAGRARGHVGGRVHSAGDVVAMWWSQCHPNRRS